MGLFSVHDVNKFTWRMILGVDKLERRISELTVQRDRYAQRLCEAICDEPTGECYDLDSIYRHQPECANYVRPD